MTGDPQPSPPDPLARHAAIAIAVVRVGIGIGALALTRPALRSLGFADPDGTSVALARLAGGRDIALGVHGLLVRDDPAACGSRRCSRAAVDAGDAGAFAAALVGATGSTGRPAEPADRGLGRRLGRLGRGAVARLGSAAGSPSVI